MISKNDCILLLTDLKNHGVDVDTQLKILIKQQEPSIEIIKYINDNRQLDLVSFYEKIRKSYNNKKNKLYINIVKEIENPTDVLTTLSALQTQILLFANNVEDRSMFLKHARAEEISYVLNYYFKTFDIIPCQKLLRIIKADIKTGEYMQGRPITE